MKSIDLMKRVYFLCTIALLFSTFLLTTSFCTVSSNPKDNWGHCIQMPNNSFECVYIANSGPPCNGTFGDINE